MKYFTLALTVAIYFAHLSAPAQADTTQALNYLHQSLNRYHHRFYVYHDADAGGNHFIPSGWMGDYQTIQFSRDAQILPYSGATCIEIQYHPENNQAWAGIYWQYPEKNWGEFQGLNLSGATVLTFYARGAQGGEKAEFKFGGIGSAEIQSTGVVTLSNTWKQYRIPLNDVDLSNVIGGFVWMTNTEQNPQGATIYLDEISFDLERLSEPRFIQSYELTSEDISSRNVAYAYDNALVLLALLARGEEQNLAAAKLIADAFVVAQQHDRYFTDGRIRNAYSSGDLQDISAGKVRLPSWWNANQEKFLEDEFHVSTDTGNIAWPWLALLEAYQQFEEQNYLEAVIRFAEWVEENCRDVRGEGGYIEGVQGWDDKQQPSLYKVTEHNIDLYPAFLRLYQVTGDKRWKSAAEHALKFVEAMWNEEEGYFWTGTDIDGETINRDVLPLDIQAWAVQAIGKQYGRGMVWADQNIRVECGYDFNQDQDGIWYEGTAQAALAWAILGQSTKYQQLINCLDAAQDSSGGMYAANHDKVTTGFDWVYNHSIHAGATSWYIFAQEKWNPYWGQRDRLVFEGLKPEYQWGEQLTVNLVEDPTTPWARTFLADIWLAVSFDNYLFFLTKEGTLNPAVWPWQPAVPIEQNKWQAFDLTVSRGMKGTYILYAAYTETGVPLNLDNLAATLRSNIAVATTFISAK